jgi:succinyl-diaminopimelate desuccinylase
MSNPRDDLLAAIENDRQELITFLSDFLKIPTPNPTGDTREACRFVSEFLTQQGLDHEVLRCHPEQPNIAASFEAGAAGRHLTLNGHMDVFPVEDGTAWTHGPWSGAIADGFIWGRGAVDMKAGTTASIFTYRYLHRVRDHLKGRLTLTVVSDEETLGSNGTRFLLDQHPHLRGDCCMNGEPSGPRTVRFGEKGLLWLELRIRTGGGHGAYPHLSRSANKIAAEVIRDLEQLSQLPVTIPDPHRDELERAYAHADQVLGHGASAVAQKVIVNIGQIRGGVKINVLPASCTIEVDIRVPVGLRIDEVKKAATALLAKYPDVEIVELNRSEPNFCPPEHDLSRIMLANARTIKGHDVDPIVGLGATDTRIWRELGIPAYVYGPSPKTMGACDERIEIVEFLDVVKVHCLSAYDYLAGPATHQP